MTEQSDRLASGLFRRLAAMLYDGLLLLATLFLGSAPFVWITGNTPLSDLFRLLFQLYLYTLGYLFFGWFWVHGGQTLGMRAWRLRLVRNEVGPLTWRLALGRYLLATLSWLVLGGGYLWILIDREKCAWHDRLTGTRIILLPKPEKESASRQEVRRNK